MKFISNCVTNRKRDNETLSPLSVITAANYVLRALNIK